MSYSGTSSFFTDNLLREARAHWVETLEDLVPDLPPVEKVLTGLPPLVEALLRH